jgi:hypothetical protein
MTPTPSRRAALALALCMGLSAGLRAQAPDAAHQDRYFKAMTAQIKALDEAETAESLLRAANGFERIAQAEPEDWLPRYYAAYAHVMRAFELTGADAVDPVLDQADQLLEQAAERSPDNPEILVLQSMATSARISVDFSRGMAMGPKATGMATKATRIDAANPRGWLQLGQQTLFTPEQFGGGAGRGCPLLRKAAERFATFEPASPVHPSWGEPYNAQLLREYCAEPDAGEEP